MCEACRQDNLNRRKMLKVAATGAAVLALGVSPAKATAAAANVMTPEQALDALRTGNARYVKNPELCVADLVAHRADVVDRQAPWAIIVACADSRVPPELIFGDRGLGELFVARNAGNLVDAATLGTIEYGAAVLGSPLVAVLGHTGCGAAHAACDVVTRRATFPESVERMIAPILPAALAVRDQPGDFADNAARESALRTSKRISAPGSLLGERVAAGKLKIVPAIYDLKSGLVTFFETHP